MRKYTPWGVTQGAVILAPGIISYETASHGGIWLSKSRQAEMGNRSDNWLKNLCVLRKSNQGTWPCLQVREQSKTGTNDTQNEQLKTKGDQKNG
jgi:hypothetical protein